MDKKFESYTRANHRVQYAKAKEKALCDKLSKLGYEVVERLGGRATHCGDVLAKLNKVYVRFDHKSTVKNTDNINFMFEWFYKLHDEAVLDDGKRQIITIPVVSVSTFQSRLIATMSHNVFEEQNASLVMRREEDQKSVTLQSSDIQDIPVITCGDVYIAKLEVLTEGIRRL